MFTRSIFPFHQSCFAALWRTNSEKFLDISGELTSFFNIESVRYRARKGTRAAALAAKKELKLKQANKPAPIPKYLQRKIKSSPELERVRCTDENWLEAEPIDNVWNMKLYRGKPYSFSEVVQILKGIHVPSLLNDPSAPVYVTTEIDLRLKKKDKYMDEFTGIITFPNEFQTIKKNKIVVVCSKAEEQMKATDAGAVYAGSTTLIKQILSGTISTEDFDYIICHPDMYKELNSLRGILKKKFPTANNGLLRLDIEKAVKSFINGIEYVSKRSSIQPDFGWVDINFGRLNMPLKEIEENLKYALNKVENHKPTGTDNLFILRTLVWCEKYREKLKIPHWDYLPNYPVNGASIEEDKREKVEEANG